MGQRVRFLSDDKLKALTEALEACTERAMLPFAYCAISSGARAGELLSLEWKDVDLAKGVAIIHKSKNSDGRKLYIRGEALAKAGIKDFRFHDLRHAAASFLAQNGATLLEIQQVLGHRTTAMVMRYAHLTESHVEAVVDRVMKDKLPGVAKAAGLVVMLGTNGRGRRSWVYWDGRGLARGCHHVHCRLHRRRRWVRRSEFHIQPHLVIVDVSTGHEACSEPPLWGLGCRATRENPTPRRVLSS